MSRGYPNPVLKLPAGQALLALTSEQRAPLEAVMRDLRAQANEEAERSWKKRKGPMAAYWRAVSTYARHIAHALSRRAQGGQGGSTLRPPSNQTEALEAFVAECEYYIGNPSAWDEYSENVSELLRRHVAAAKYALAVQP